MLASMLIFPQQLLHVTNSGIVSHFSLYILNAQKRLNVRIMSGMMPPSTLVGRVFLVIHQVPDAPELSVTAFNEGVWCRGTYFNDFTHFSATNPKWEHCVIHSAHRRSSLLLRPRMDHPGFFIHNLS
jgi:hypothetical protein